MTKDNQKGVTLVVVFLIMTVMLAAVLGLSTVLFNKIKILGNIGNSVSSFYAAESGLEKTLYFDRKQIPKKGKRGLCDICNTCPDCQNCTLTPLSAGGCNPLTCSNCSLSYNATFNDKSYIISAKVTPSLFFSCNSKGIYKDTTRTIEVISTSISGPVK